jgi:diguanylate cyclase (GGDEF)-like protein
MRLLGKQAAIHSPAHPRTLGWVGTTALAMGGSNQMIFLITALFVGQGNILGQGSVAVPLLIVGLLLSWAAAPAWTELVLMWPNRVGGIAAACAEAFRPYSPVLAALTGTCYWWGWVPTCGLTALLSAAAIKQWYFPGLPVEAVAIAIIVVFSAVNLAGVKRVARLAIPLATVSASLAFISSLAPIFAGAVDWRTATTYSLTSPFPGWFGDVTSIMAGLYLIGFAAPAFEAATCHVGETIDPNRNVPRAMLASAAMAGVYFLVLPVVWLGVLGPEPLGRDLAVVLGPTFAPLLGSFGKAAAVWFIIFNMFHGTLQPLAGAARTIAQLSEDGLLPRFLGARSAATDTPWVATLMTAGFAIIFLLIGDPVWVIAAANFTYLISVCMPIVAAWLLRRDQPNAARPYRAPRGLIGLGLGSAVIWLVSAILGFQQFGLPTVLFGLALAYSGAGLYAWRLIEDRRRQGLPRFARTLHLKLTGAMLLVLVLDGAGYLMAVGNVSNEQTALIAALEDIFVAVAILSVSVGIVLPGMITHSATEVTAAARRLATGTLREFSDAMAALGRGDLDAAQASMNIVPVRINSRDELGEMGESFNVLQDEVREAAVGLNNARDNMRAAQKRLIETNADIVHLAHHDSLTGLPNRAAFTEHLAEALRDASVTRSDFAVVCIDLDEFKEANDVFGHAAGDQLLAAVAQRLKGAIGEAFLARVGGDEFTVISAVGKQPETAAALAEHLLKIASEPFTINGQSLRIGLSIGAAVFPRDGTDASALLANADAALYRAKAEGRQIIRFFEADMDRHVRETHALQSDLRSAIARGQMEIEYQPQATINGIVFGFEALVRWRHPTRGLIAPTDFIALAERNGVISEIGELVLRQAAREAASWQSKLQVSVNLSPVQFRHDELPNTVHAILLETGLAPGRLELEITEGVLMKDSQRSLSLLRRLKALGVKIAMDDFGTGYSSLSALQSFPFDKIKIDRSFVAGLSTSEQSRAIVRSVIGLGSTLRMPVIAEGAETEEQRMFLKREGCAEIQGYLIGRPRSIADYAELTAGVTTFGARAG